MAWLPLSGQRSKMVEGYTRAPSHQEDVERNDTAPSLPAAATHKPPVSRSSAIRPPRSPTTRKTRRKLYAGLLGLASAITCAVAAGTAAVSSRRYLEADEAATASTPDAEGSIASLATRTRLDSKPCADSAGGEGCLPMGKRELRDLVHDCARGLEIPGGDSCSEELTGNSYRVPFMTSGGGLPCSFEVRTVEPRPI